MRRVVLESPYAGVCAVVRVEQEFAVRARASKPPKKKSVRGS